MNYTKNLNLKKPGENDYYDIDNHNDNYDAIDAAIGKIKAITDNIESDIPEIKAINKEVVSISETVKRIKEEITEVNANAELIEARGNEKFLGNRLDKFDEQLDNKASKFDIEATNKRVDNLMLETGNTDLEVQDSRFSLTKNKNYTTLRERLDGIEKDTCISLHNVIKNGDFSQGKKEWDGVGNHNTITITNEMVFNGTALANGTSYKQELKIPTNSLIAVCFSFSNSGNVKPQIMLSDYNSNSNHSFIEFNVGNNIILTNAKSGGTRIQFRQVKDDSYNNAIFDNIVVIDLTSAFGAGKEPDAEYVEKILKDNNRHFDVANIVKSVIEKNKQDINDVKQDINDVKQDIKNIKETNVSSALSLNDKKVLIIGDSISTDYYQNYKKWVTTLIEEGFFPGDVNNNSIHATGFVAKYTGDGYADNNFVDRIEAVAEKSTYDFVIIFGGINDFIQSVPFGEAGGNKKINFVPAVDYFFEYLVNNFVQARIIIISPLRTYNIYPNKVGKLQTEYADYIKEKAKYYCLPTLNLTEESGFCPFIQSFKEKWTLKPKGYDNHDGVHPTEEYEEKYLAPVIRNFLLKYI